MSNNKKKTSAANATPPKTPPAKGPPSLTKAPTASKAPPASKTIATPPGRKNPKKVKKTKKLPSGWYLWSKEYYGGHNVTEISLSTRTDDAYYQPLKDLFNKDQEEDHELLNMGIYGTATLRHSLINGNELKNSKNGFSRQCILQIMDAEDATEEARLSLLMSIKKFLEEKKNNAYGTEVHIMQPGWNLNEPGAPLPKLDTRIVYKDIVEIIRASFDDTDSGDWAAKNMEAAMTYFTEGHIPYAAADDLGFPRELVNDPINLP